MAPVRTYARQGRTFGRYAGGLRRFLRTPLTGAQCRERIAWQLENREATFASLLQRTVFERPSSPYRRLFKHAGIELGDVDRLLRERGVESTLGVLFDAGVRLRLDELKGRQPIERPGLSYDVRPEDFDNPLLDPVFATRSSGSTGVARAVQLDFAAIEHDTVYSWLLFEAVGAWERQHVMWRTVPPGGSGLQNVLALNKLGIPLARWFTQTWPALTLQGVGERAFVRYTNASIRRWGAGVGPVEHVPIDQAARVAHWVAAAVAGGARPLVNAPASSAVRVANAAAEAGLEITGTLFRVGGEPLTAAKASSLKAVGGDVVCNYSMAEIGRVGAGCPTSDAVDDVHVMTGKIGVIQRELQDAARPVPAQGLWLSSLHTACRKVMINVEVGDYGTLEDRDCGCVAGELGLTTHLHHIGSHDKLTTEGMSFVGSELDELLEDVLPRRFGGRVGDYQLVEAEEGGRTTLSLIVSPRVGEVDGAEVVRAVLAVIARGPSYKQMMATVLRDADALRVLRRQPHASSTGKIPAVRLLPR